MPYPFNNRPTRVIFLRHGQSTYNALGLYQGCSDESVLTEAGRQTARQTGAFLRGIKFDAVYTSPLKRAQETTRQVLGAMKYRLDPEQIHVVPLLRETDLPAWQGLPFQQVREQFPADYVRWKQKPHQFSMEVVREGLKQPFYPALDLYDRLQQFWQEVLPRHRHQTLLVVAHGGTNRAAIATALGIDPSHYHTIQQSNCALNVLHFPKGDLSSARLEAINLTTHVDEALPQPKEGGRGLRLLLVPTRGAQPKQDWKLASLLQAVPIQFSIRDDHDCTQQALAEFVESHPETVLHQVMRQDFLESWQQVLAQTKSNDQLTTGLVVAHPDVIARLLGEVMGIEKEQRWRLQLQPGTLSAIHYPATSHPPILQTMNVCSAWQEQDLGLQTLATPSTAVI